ncbi:MAG: SusD/RagB family nutrient-binding outer membrane lipoprotein [Bacteroidota bacterium]
MIRIRYIHFIVLALTMLLFQACQDLDDLNINPNGVDPEDADPSLLLATVITQTGQIVVDLGFGHLAGVMQHTQLDGWSGSHNNYNWDNDSHSWRNQYSILRNVQELYTKADEMDLLFYKGVALVMEAYLFGMITDLWGDAPFSAALHGDLEGSENVKPVFDPQQEIYLGIIDKLTEANLLLSGDKKDYESVNATQDVLYHGDIEKWQKLANSLTIRYYMRISEKEPTLARAAINNIVANPDKYPLILEAEEDASVKYIGNSSADSWPSNTKFDISEDGKYFRTKLCATLVDTLQAFNDPRLAVWASPVEYPLVLDPSLPDNGDTIIDNMRYIARNVADNYESTTGYPLDYDPEYVGLPPSCSFAPVYNLNPNLGQGLYNPHASQLNEMYKESAGPMLQARLISSAEVNFTLAEAAYLGWIPRSASGYYKAGVKASLQAWGVGSVYDDYISGVPYAGLEEIMFQKWIASWTAAAESWFDYRRTGLPELQTGEASSRPVLPLRFYYHQKDEIDLNEENANAAIAELEATEYTAPDSRNSAWSKMWLLQGTGKPY